jgi:acylphosphatase
MSIERLHIIVTGSVQGVFFRAGVQSEARKLGLSGWVRNREDGSVELEAEGERGSLESLLIWCYHGPKGASVSDLEFAWLDACGAYAGFEIRQE